MVFQNMPHIFAGLENAFAGPGWTWKYHKSKVQEILHRNYIQKSFSTPRKNIYFARSKIFPKIFRKFLVRKNFVRKIEKFQNVEI